MPARRSLLFDRWPRFASRHPWLVVSGALAPVILFGALYWLGRGSYGDVFVVPGAESQELIDMLKSRFPERAGDSANVVVRASGGLDGKGVPSKVESVRNELQQLPGVVAVSSPYDTPGAISPDGTIARISVQYSEPASQLDRGAVEELLVWQRQSTAPDFQVEAGGALMRHWSRRRESSRVSV